MESSAWRDRDMFARLGKRHRGRIVTSKSARRVSDVHGSGIRVACGSRNATAACRMVSGDF